MNLQRLLAATVGLILVGLAAFGQSFEIGDAIWAQWTPNDWYPGTLVEETALGYVVVFADVTDVEGVADDLPTSAEIPTSLIVLDRVPEASDVILGTRVLALWPDDGWYYPATVVTEANEGLYNVVFDDHDVTVADLTGLRLRREPTALFNVPVVGDRVWVQWEPDDWYPGIVTEENSLGLHVLFDDGDEADRPTSLVVVDLAPEADQVGFGSRVLAHLTGEWFYPGTIVKVLEDGAYDVLFDTGERKVVALASLRLFSE